MALCKQRYIKKVTGPKNVNIPIAAELEGKIKSGNNLSKLWWPNQAIIPSIDLVWFHFISQASPPFDYPTTLLDTASAANKFFIFRLL